MKATQIYSVFSHEFMCGSDLPIIYRESQYILVREQRKDYAILIKGEKFYKLANTSLKENDYHGSTIVISDDESVNAIRWANPEPWVERLKQDFIALKRNKQIIHFCDGTIKVITRDDISVALSSLAAKSMIGAE